MRAPAEGGRGVGAVLDKHKMGKHYDLTITDSSFTYHRKEEAIATEACLDGVYVIRTNVPKEAFRRNRWSAPTNPLPGSSEPFAA